MIILGKYDEFAPNMGFPSAKNNIGDKPHAEKDKILKHMNSGTVHIVTASRVVDIFTGEKADRELVHMNDGKYSWSSNLTYHVEKYNLELPDDFVNHILKK